MKWNEISIGELGEVITGNTPLTTNREFYGGPYPFIKPTDMEIDRRHVTRWEENYSEKAYKKYKNAYIPPGSTGVVTIGTVGEKIFQADNYCFTNQSVNVVVPDIKKFDADFVYYLLKYNLPKVSNANPGTASGRHHVSKSNFSSIKVLVPARKADQQKIGAILSSYDDLIENNLKRVMLLEEVAQRTYEEWFVNFCVGGETLTLNNTTGLPDSWERRELNEVVQLIRKPTMPKDVPQGTPYIGLEHIPRKSITLSTWEEASKVDSLKYQFKKGDILFGKIRPYFHKVGVALVDGIASSDTLILRPINNDFHGIILQTVFSEKFVSTATQSSNGTKMPRANWNVLKKYPVIIPDNAVAISFAKLSKNVVDGIERLSRTNRILKEARDILLPRLMGGAVDVSALDEKLMMAET